MGGHTCLQWSSKEAKALSKNKDFSLEVSLPGNKCRNPDKDPEGPWCYVMVSGNVTIDYCDLPLCGNNDITTYSSSMTAVYGTWFWVKHLSLSSTEDLLSVSEPLDTGAQQRTTLSSPRKRFFNPKTFGQGEDGKPLANFNALRIKTISNPTFAMLVQKPEMDITDIKSLLPAMTNHFYCVSGVWAGSTCG